MSTKIRVSENSLEIKLEGEGLNLSLPSLLSYSS